MKKILVAHDLTKFGDAAADEAVDLASSLDASLILFHVEPPMNVPPGQQNGEHTFQTLQKLQAELEKVAARLRAKAPHLQISCEATMGEPAPSIIEEAKRAEVDFIVTGTHAKKGLTRVVLGSVAEDVIRNAPVPVLVTRPRGGAS